MSKSKKTKLLFLGLAAVWLLIMVGFCGLVIDRCQATPPPPTVTITKPATFTPKPTDTEIPPTLTATQETVAPTLEPSFTPTHEPTKTPRPTWTDVPTLPPLKVPYCTCFFNGGTYSNLTCASVVEGIRYFWQGDCPDFVAK